MGSGELKIDKIDLNQWSSCFFFLSICSELNGAGAKYPAFASVICHKLVVTKYYKWWVYSARNADTDWRPETQGILVNVRELKLCIVCASVESPDETKHWPKIRDPTFWPEIETLSTLSEKLLYL